MSEKPGIVKVGYLSVEWDEHGNTKLVRTDNMQHIELSITEMEMVQRALYFRGLPIVRWLEAPQRDDD